MATSMQLVETFKESAEYTQIQTLFEKLMGIEDDTVVHVMLSVQTVRPDSTVKDDHVIWSRRYKCVED